MKRNKRAARFGMAYLGYPHWPYSMARTRRAVQALDRFLKEWQSVERSVKEWHSR